MYISNCVSCQMHRYVRRTGQSSRSVMTCSQKSTHSSLSKHVSTWALADFRMALTASRVAVIGARACAIRTSLGDRDSSLAVILAVKPSTLSIGCIRALVAVFVCRSRPAPHVVLACLPAQEDSALSYDSKGVSCSPSGDVSAATRRNMQLINSVRCPI